MKKILLFLLCSSFFCGKCEKEKYIPPTGTSPEYEDMVMIRIRGLRDPRINAIKVTLKNLDGIQPQFNTIDNVEEKRGEYHSSYDNETYYFENIFIYFRPPHDADEKLELSLGKKRIYEMKLYVNDMLFFTKKISFTPKRSREGPLLESMLSAHKIEVDDMKYVLRIEHHYYYFKCYVCEIFFGERILRPFLDARR